MTRTIRMVGHEDRLSLVDHLGELRTRLFVSLIAVGIAFGFAFWQNAALLRILDRPLAHQTQGQIAQGRGPLGQTAIDQQAIRRLAGEQRAVLEILAQPRSGLGVQARTELARQQGEVQAAIARLPVHPEGAKPVTLGIGEPFTVTIKVAFYFALLLALPILLFQAYAFVLPAFAPGQRRAVLPLLLAVPALFVAGVVFGYFAVLPPAIHFLQNFNTDSFNVLVQAAGYYSFAIFMLAAMGLIFQVPVGVLAVTRLGIVTPRQLRKGRRYAIVGAAAIAAVLPGTDPLSMLLQMVPLLVLYEASILLASLFERRAKARAAHETAHAGAPV